MYVIGNRLVRALKVASDVTGNRKCRKTGSKPKNSDCGQMMLYFYFLKYDVFRRKLLFFLPKNDAFNLILMSNFDFRQQKMKKLTFSFTAYYYKRQPRGCRRNRIALAAIWDKMVPNRKISFKMLKVLWKLIINYRIV